MTDRRIVRERVAGQSAMQQVLDLQVGRPARTPAARLFGVSPLAPAARSAYRAALAELAVGEALEQLGARWDVLHDLPLTTGVLDHLVIGPAGVYAVRAVQCGGGEVVADGHRLGVGGVWRHDLTIATAQADAASAILGLPVQPLVVLVAARRVTGRGAPAIARASEVHRRLTRAPAILAGEAVAAISDRADLASTWPMADSTALDSRQLHRDFARLRTRVRHASERRTLWLAAGVGAGYLLVWSTVGLIVTSAIT